MEETWVQSLGGEDTLENEMVTHSSFQNTGPTEDIFRDYFDGETSHCNSHIPPVTPHIVMRLHRGEKSWPPNPYPSWQCPFLLRHARLLCPWDFPSKNTRVGCHLLLQGIFPTQGSNPHFLHCSETGMGDVARII